MWHALRAELAYYRSYLLGGLGLAVGITALVSTIFWAVGEDGPPEHSATGIRAMFMIMAPMIVGFVIQGVRPEEKRERLLLSGPVTPRQIAGIWICMSLLLLAIGVAAAAALLGGSYLVTGRLAVESVHLPAFVGGLMFGILHLIPLAQEAVVARDQGRRRQATLAWAAFGVAIVVFSLPTVASLTLQGPQTWPSMHVANLLVAVTAMAAATALYTRRTDFTR